MSRASTRSQRRPSGQRNASTICSRSVGYGIGLSADIRGSLGSPRSYWRQGTTEANGRWRASAIRAAQLASAGLAHRATASATLQRAYGKSPRNRAEQGIQGDKNGSERSDAGGAML